MLACVGPASLLTGSLDSVTFVTVAAVGLAQIQFCYVHSSGIECGSTVYQEPWEFRYY